MRLRLLCLIAGLVLMWGAPASFAEEKPRLINYRAEYFWRKEFEFLGPHKAIAISGNGAIGYSYNAPDKATAESLALGYCNDSLSSWTRKGETPEPCQIMATDADRAQPDPLMDTGWQEEAKGPDRPLRKGLRQLLPKGEAKGIVVHVHGCDGLGDKSVLRIWGDYLNALGYDFYAPVSFAEKRPKQVCGKVTEHPIDQTSTVWRLRVAQTLRTVASLRKERPGVPIYLWGHSEGGRIVQMVDADVAGIIVTGEECGIDGTTVAAPTRVPFLFLLGQYDPYVDGLGVPVSPQSEAICAARLKDHKFTYLVVKDAKHNPYPWHAPTSLAVPQFLGAAPVSVSPAANGAKARASWKKQRVTRQYRKAKANKLAAGTGGRYYGITGAEDLEDARQYVVFACDKSVSPKTNVFKTGKHLCTLVDVNGTPEK
jgi:hypothetical protein